MLHKRCLCYSFQSSYGYNHEVGCTYHYCILYGNTYDWTCDIASRTALAQTAFNSLGKSGSIALLVFLLLFPTYPDLNAQEVNYAVLRGVLLGAQGLGFGTSLRDL
jgi:hypothetical protein